MTFDVDRARAGYPALREGYTHFDSAAGTLVAERSASAMAEVTRSAVGNRTAAFAAGRRSEEIVVRARQAVADLLGATPSGVVFGSSATSLTYLVSRTLGATWGPGDEVVVSRLDHDANVRPWVQAAARAGATLRWAEFEPATGVLPAEQYTDLVNDRTRVVAVTAASNAIGGRPDVAAIARIAHTAGALVYVDGVHATPHAPTDVAALGADFYVTSAYKWSGPHLAACVAAPELWERLRPEKLMPSSDEVPDRFEFGTPSFELLAGVAGAVDHFEDLVGGEGERRERILGSLRAAQAYEMDLFTRLVGELAETPGVVMCPAPENRCPTVAFRVGDQHPDETATRLGDEGVCVYSGDYYAYEYFRAVKLRDTGGAVRASVYHYNSSDDVGRLLDAIKRCR